MVTKNGMLYKHSQHHINAGCNLTEEIKSEPTKNIERGTVQWTLVTEMWIKYRQKGHLCPGLEQTDG